MLRNKRIRPTKTPQATRSHSKSHHISKLSLLKVESPCSRVTNNYCQRVPSSFGRQTQTLSPRHRSNTDISAHRTSLLLPTAAGQREDSLAYLFQDQDQFRQEPPLSLVKPIPHSSPREHRASDPISKIPAQQQQQRQRHDMASKNRYNNNKSGGFKGKRGNKSEKQEFTPYTDARIFTNMIMTPSAFSYSSARPRWATQLEHALKPSTERDMFHPLTPFPSIIPPTDHTQSCIDLHKLSDAEIRSMCSTPLPSREKDALPETVQHLPPLSDFAPHTYKISMGPIKYRVSRGNKFKVGLMLSYRGTGYSGLQIQPNNPTHQTIEGEVFTALVKAGLIEASNTERLSKVKWSRAARTDKGVHAASNIISVNLRIPFIFQSPEVLTTHKKAVWLGTKRFYQLLPLFTAELSAFETDLRGALTHISNHANDAALFQQQICSGAGQDPLDPTTFQEAVSKLSNDELLLEHVGVNILGDFIISPPIELFLLSRGISPEEFLKKINSAVPSIQYSDYETRMLKLNCDLGSEFDPVDTEEDDDDGDEQDHGHESKSATKQSNQDDNEDDIPTQTQTNAKDDTSRKILGNLATNLSQRGKGTGNTRAARPKTRAEIQQEHWELKRHGVVALQRGESPAMVLASSSSSSQANNNNDNAESNDIPVGNHLISDTAPVTESWHRTPGVVQANRRDGLFSDHELVRLCSHDYLSDTIANIMRPHLSHQLHISRVIRVQGSFDAKVNASSRTYEYIIPSFAFMPIADYPEGLYEQMVSLVKQNQQQTMQDDTSTSLHDGHESNETPADAPNGVAKTMDDDAVTTHPPDDAEQPTSPTSEGNPAAKRSYPLETHKDEPAGLLEVQTKNLPDTPPELLNYKLPDAQRERIATILQNFLGTKNHWNLTIQKNYKDASANRFIRAFRPAGVFYVDGVEFAHIVVHGDSFLLHQIRKMMGLTIGLVRGGLGIDEGIFDRVFTEEKCNTPMAPALGLLLDHVHYDGYDKRVKELSTNALKDSKTYHQVRDTYYGHYTQALPLINEIKLREIYQEIGVQELQTFSTWRWLHILNMHQVDDDKIDANRVNNRFKMINRKYLKSASVVNLNEQNVDMKYVQLVGSTTAANPFASSAGTPASTPSAEDERL